jgi:uncharacterized protein YkwD
MKRIFTTLLSAVIACVMVFSFASAAGNTSQTCAQRLYSLGLLKGTGNNADGTPNFALDSATNRAQAVTMLVRLLGCEQTALNQNLSCPFTDVPAWAKPYVGYAYQHGLTKGVSANQFGSNDPVSCNQYTTFLLRSLGYSESAGDFTWNCATTLSDKIGLTNGNYNGAKDLVRGDVATLSSCALDQKVVGCGKTLLQSLNTTNANTGTNTSNSTNTATTTNTSTSTSNNTTPTSTTTAYIQEVVRLVNEARAGQGLPALTLDSTMTSAAMVRAKEIQTSFSHTRPNGTTCFTALDAAGVSYRAAGENIAYGQRTPSDVVTGWLNSPGHRANIMSTSFTRIGVGYVVGSNGTAYWSQFFCS